MTKTKESIIKVSKLMKKTVRTDFRSDQIVTKED
jgi:hypothetical protein